MFKKKNPGARQGDVLVRYVPAGTIPAGARPIVRDRRGRVVLAEGEVTGHAHAVLEPGVEYLETGTGEAAERWLRVQDTATLVHEEHAAHVLPPGEAEQWFPYEYVSDEELRRDVD